MNENISALESATQANARATANFIAAGVLGGREPDEVIDSLCQGDGRFWTRQALIVNATPAN